ncbi:hypothetical protein K8B83_00670 [Shewanella inventionis]|uniref:Uncharacterized protein n=1 Tax=Shewanella inventionis TaxID=1738770 RepID=A0ABQ1IKI2_9GAMM|nr:hypothetical protein [Shewanella inventionis]MCL1156419.1 hypothetical protein [Shewanella inventionis]UAL43442.1 hypothetical protein K8B83_00670 [Shewanella inventionis]GGB45400.1 hypothetical protein GCM10011607_01810 [Shewanella inventionis]
MIINTHYPQVPLATSNVATDLARVDNQQKPPIIPPQEPSKGHEERAFNPQNERAQAFVVAEKKQQQDQSQRQQQNLTQQSVDPKALLQQATRPQTVRIMASNTPALQRKDIQIKSQSATTKSYIESTPRQADSSMTNATAQQFGMRIGQFYQQQSAPNLESQLQILA